MINLLIRLVVSTLIVIVADNLLDGIGVSSTQTAIVVAIVMGLLNTFVKPVLQFFAIPITIITLGLFYFVVNALVVYLCDFLVSGFEVSNFMSALLFSILFSIGQTLVGWFVK